MPTEHQKTIFYKKTCGGKTKKEKKAMIYRNLFQMMNHLCFIRLLSYLRAKYPLKYNLTLDCKLSSLPLSLFHICERVPNPNATSSTWFPVSGSPKADERNVPISLFSKSLVHTQPVATSLLVSIDFFPMYDFDFS